MKNLNSIQKVTDMRFISGIMGLIFLTFFAFLLNISFGSVSIPIVEVIYALSGREVSNPAWTTIILGSRLPSALMAVFAGGGLAVAGLQMQTLFRNPVAGPYILGISSGASLGVAILVLLTSGIGIQVLGFQGTLNNWALIIASGIGSVLIFMLMVMFSYRVKDITILLIIGLMIGSATSAFISILQLYTQQEGLQSYIFWTFGSFRNVTMQQVYLVIPVVAAGLMISIALIKSLNVMLLGEHYAESLGLPIRRVRIWIVISTCILAAGITAFCGPIAFIGLAVPHLARWWFNTSDHAVLIPVSLLLGGCAAAFCNLAAMVPGSDYTLPINAVTSLLGAPVVIWVIMNRKYSAREFN